MENLYLKMPQKKSYDFQLKKKCLYQKMLQTFN